MRGSVATEFLNKIVCNNVYKRDSRDRGPHIHIIIIICQSSAGFWIFYITGEHRQNLVMLVG